MTPPLTDFIDRAQRLFMLTGAGCSTASGIPDYRDTDGQWKRTPPVTYQAFMGEAATRQRYWARSLLGWPRFGLAQPNGTHQALAALEKQGKVQLLLTQNVDGLHQRAGSQNVIDLHGRLDLVRCMGCERRSGRQAFQQRLLDANPGWDTFEAGIAPDGDADLETDFSSFVVPDCPSCGGLLKPDVVFFGENVPAPRVARCYDAVDALGSSGALLCVGTSLTVMSGFRFVRRAAKAGTPVVIVNRGGTRGDELATYKVEAGCSEFLGDLVA